MKFQSIRSHLLLFLILNFSAALSRAQVVINEFSASNLNQYMDNHNDYNDWIELYNTSGSSVNLGGYFLSDDSSNSTKWQIPGGISIAGNGFLRFWTSGRNEVAGGNYHTSFKLKQTKNNPEFVVLSNPSGTIIDYFKLTKKTQLGHSYGHTTNGAGTWSIFTFPTPNSSNNSYAPYLRYADRPDFSVTAGFYPSSVTLTITTTEPNSAIRYTTDGTLPTAFSSVYSSPVTISATKVLKAITISNDPNILPSFIEFATYFINANHTLPVVSIAGTELTDLANGNDLLIPLGSFEYFDLTKQRTAKTYGEFNKHGQDSWILSQRSLDFISRDEMGYNHSVEEKLFVMSDRNDFQRVILRAAGDDNYPADHNFDNLGSAHLRDAFVENLADTGGLHLDVRRGSKIVVYLNGQYWGVYDIRENPDDHDFTDYYYAQDKFNIQYIETWGGTWAEYGGAQALADWDNLYNYIMSNNMTNAAAYQYVTDRLDVTSLVDYVLLNMFTVCSDWLNYNTGWWRGLDSSGTHLKWGYILWDNDAVFGHYINYTGIPDKTANALPCDPEGLPSPWPDVNGHIEILNKLMDNPDFEQYYISRQIDLWNTVFSCDFMLANLDSTIALIDPEMTLHANRWTGTYSEWQTNVQTLRNFIIQRCAALTAGFKTCYNLTGPYDLVLNADPPNSGSVKLNSLVLNQFPWNGKYFGGIDTKLEAIPDSGNQFINWSADFHAFNPNNTTVSVKVSLSTADTIVAHFFDNTSIPEQDLFTADVSVYPTVFSNQLTIEYNLAAPSHVSIKLYSLLGNKIAEVVSPDAFARKGHFTADLNLSGKNIPAGMYLLDFSAGNFRKCIKVIYSPH